MSDAQDIKQGMEKIFGAIQGLEQRMSAQENTLQASLGSASSQGPATQAVGNSFFQPRVKAEPGIRSFSTTTQDSIPALTPELITKLEQLPAAANLLKVEPPEDKVIFGVKKERGTALDAQIAELLGLRGQLDSKLQALGIPVEGTKKLAGEKSGRNATFPPRPSKQGLRYYHVTGTMTTNPGIYCGWRAAEKGFNRGRGWKDMEKGDVIGWEELQDAVAFFFQEDDKCFTVTLWK